MVCDSTGCLGLYSFDQDEGGDCSLIKQFYLVDNKHTLAHNNDLDLDNIDEHDSSAQPDLPSQGESYPVF